MINVSASSIVSAKRDSDNLGSICRDPTQTRIAPEKSRDTFPIIALRDLDTFHPFP